MVMPRSCSRSILSSICPWVTWMVLVYSSKRSAKVDFPWSMCAMMQKFLIFFIENANYPIYQVAKVVKKKHFLEPLGTDYTKFFLSSLFILRWKYFFLLKKYLPLFVNSRSGFTAFCVLFYYRYLCVCWLDDLTDFVMQKIIIRTAKGVAQIFTRVLEEGHCRWKILGGLMRKF